MEGDGKDFGKEVEVEAGGGERAIINWGKFLVYS
jgi:hypothetical protein